MSEASAGGRAGGKAILAGEHFVVHGGPAIAVPVPGVALEATLRRSTGAPRPAGHVAACLAVLRERWGGPADEELVVDIRSDIPIGAGLGSSAALSVALARAWGRWIGRTLDTAELREASLACERIAHGNPSGIDSEVALTGRAVRFVRGELPRPLAVATGVGLVVADTGVSVATREMVEAVARRRTADPGEFARALRRAAELVDAAERALSTADVTALGETLDENQRLLASVGVSTPAVERAAAAARSAGAAGAKLTGKGGGGCVIAACRTAQTADVAERLRRDGWKVVASGEISATPVPEPASGAPGGARGQERKP